MSNFCIFATISLKPEYFESAKKALLGQVDRALREVGCHVFTLLEAKDIANTLYLYEEYESESALDHHLEKEYTKQIFEQYKLWLDAPVTLIKLNRLK